MDRWMRAGWVGLMALCLAQPVMGCGSKASDKSSKDDDDDDKKSKKHKKSDDDDDDDKKSKKHKKSDDDDDDKKSSKKDNDKKSAKDSDKGDDIDAKAILSEGGDDAKGIDVKLPEESASGRSVGTGAPPPANGPLSWIPAGNLAMPNPGWTKTDAAGPMVLLASPNKKAVVLFTNFSTDHDGATKVDNITRAMKMTNFNWKKPKPYRFGPDKVPALFGTGSATQSDGKPAKLYYALIRTGGTVNILAVGGADADADDATLKQGLIPLFYIKRTH